MNRKYLFDLIHFSYSGTDLIVGGLKPNRTISSNFILSSPYMQDNLTWCLQKATAKSWIMSFMTAISPATWILLLLGPIYGTSCILYLMMQFDRNYEQRNNRDWHYTVILIALPMLTGLNQRFQPKSWSIRVFYGCMVLSMFAFAQIGATFTFKYIKLQFPTYQMATVEELARNEMILMGSEHAWDLVRTSKMVCFWNMTDFSFSSMRWSSFLNLHFLHILRILIFLIIIFLFGYFRFKKNNQFLTIFLDFIPYFLDFSRFSLNFFPFRFLVSNYK